MKQILQKIQDQRCIYVVAVVVVAVAVDDDDNN